MVTTPNCFNNLGVAALVFGTFALSGYTAAPLPPTTATVAITVEETGPAGPVESTAMVSADSAPNGWSDIKDYTPEKRSQFLAGLQKMEAKVNAQLNELAAKRSGLKDTAKRKGLDQALNELSEARFFLKTMGEGLNRTTAQTWEQMKAKVGLAWTKSQEAYAKTLTGTTG